MLARAMIRLLLDNFTPQAGGFIPRAYHSIIVGLFGESWQRISGSRSALYENANPSRDGMFSLVAILETDNGEQFVSDMTGLTRFVNPSEILDDVDDAIAEDLIAKLILDLGDERYQIRQSASVKLGLIGEPALEALDKAKQSDDAEVRYRSQTLIKEIERSLAAARADLINGDLLLRIKPRFSYFPKQESSSGRSVGFVRIQLKDDQAPLAGQLRTLFGPQWSTIRLATVDDNVIVLLGSNSSLMEQAIANVKSGRTGIDLSRRFAAFHDRVRREPTSEFHLSLSRAELQFVDRDLDKSSTTTSFGLSIAPQQVRVDLFAPFEEVRVFYERLNRQ